MDLERTLWTSALGFVAGLLGSILLKERGFGLIGDTLVGILGSFLGGFLFRQIPAAPDATDFGFVGVMITSIAGAIILLVAANFVRRAIV